MNQGYERGWRRYTFDEVAVNPAHAHGADVEIRAGAAFNRGPGDLHVSFVEIPARHTGDAIGLHIHRDVPTGSDVEEWYIVVEGECVMSFTTGEEVRLGPGDLVTTYPGTGHALRVLGDQPVRIIAVVPHAFRTDRPAALYDTLPDEFRPQIRVLACDPVSMVPQEACCVICGSLWSTDQQDSRSRTLPEWARSHACRSRQ